ncbi:hypothetical protein GCM10011507_09900 [Edaphobacter acidisoli]|uniref:TPM domain-containing protein n=1 Tax=Edaphobacter acidisoli TaxID=2040573 RepID=A0A916W1N7_9BACT|nr:TPM domain-containing protein [Edaphobacter acidisoli]GGA60379.1 hypothetical protein GCM10011507_09900 [Edaphobacter acidisoli]
MKRISRWLAVAVLLFVPSAFLAAESVDSLPAPVGYVNDFAGVLSPSTIRNVDDLCEQVEVKAHAQIAVVTIKTLDNNQSIEEFATALEDKWKVGERGTDRGVLMILVMTPRRGRIEVGYGLEGILNDAKVGDIGRSMVPAASRGDYNTAVPLGIGQIAQIIASDAGVTLTNAQTAQPVQQYNYSSQPVHISLAELIIGGGLLLLVLIFLISTGNTGLIWFLLGNLLGGGFGGGRGRDDWNQGGGFGGGGGGGFGGFGGGSSGGGGASGDF